jgi:hypothetical protein
MIAMSRPLLVPWMNASRAASAMWLPVGPPIWWAMVRAPASEERAVSSAVWGRGERAAAAWWV